MNDLMSAGVHRLWKDAALNWLAPSPSRASTLIDVAGGTGDIASLFLKRAGPGSRVTICDISGEMLAEGAERLVQQRQNGTAAFVQGNAEHLPVHSSSMQYYTIAFGIRNVNDMASALREAHRVLRPGGRFMCLEFSRVTMPVLDAVYERYSDKVVPELGRMVTGDAEPYRYLVESIRKFPDQVAFARMIEAAGFVRVQYRSLSGGIAALHSGLKV